LYHELDEGIVQMITPNVSPLSSPSSAVTREGALADWIQALSPQAGGAGIAPGDFPLTWQVIELDTTFPEILRPDATTVEVDFPSQYAMGIARALCYDVDRIIGNIVSFADCEAFEGDLLIHWRSADRGITLICPSDSDRQPKLYREELRDGKLLKSEIMPDPRASDIALAIKWVWNEA
jgi:hypothetical protein